MNLNNPTLNEVQCGVVYRLYPACRRHATLRKTSHLHTLLLAFLGTVEGWEWVINNGNGTGCQCLMLLRLGGVDNYSLIVLGERCNFAVDFETLK